MLIYVFAGVHTYGDYYRRGLCLSLSLSLWRLQEMWGKEIVIAAQTNDKQRAVGVIAG